MERLNQWVFERCYKGSLYIMVFCFLLLAIIFGCSKENIPVYQLGLSITFGKGGTAEPYQKKGWSGPEEGFTWTDGNSSELLMKIDKPKSDIIMTAALEPLTVPGKIGKQRVAININGKKAGEWSVNASGEYKLNIPQDYLKGSGLNITFELPDAASPLELGVSKDSRKLGLAIKSINLSEK